MSDNKGSAGSWVPEEEREKVAVRAGAVVAVRLRL